jgi:DNA-binding CsgD family transcriptional regulator
MTTSRRPRYPEDAIADLTARQREVLALLAKRRTNAEIASDLGISLDGAKWHVSEIIGRLGVESRDEAAECWRRYNGLPARLRRIALGLAAAGSLRWAAAGAALVAIGLAAAVVLALRDDGSPPATGTPADGSPTPIPTPSGPAPFSLVPAPGVLQPRTYSSGVQIPESHGVFFMAPSTGQLEGWVSTEDITPTYVSEDGRYVAFSSYGVGYLLDRERRQSYTWPVDRFRFLAGHDDHLLFQELTQISEPGDYVRTSGTGTILVTDPSGAVRATAHLPGERIYYTALFHPVAPQVLILDSDAVYRVHLSTGAVDQVFVVPPDPNGVPGGAGRLAHTADPDVVVVSAFFRDSSSDEPPATEFANERAWRLTWDGTVLASVKATTYFSDAIYFSPDGRYVAWEEYLRPTRAIAYGTWDRWPTLVIADARTAEPLVRIRSAAVIYGDMLLGNRWLADSSAIVAMVRGEALPEALDDLTYALIRPDGSIQELPDLSTGAPDWYSRASYFGAIPSPTDANLIAFGRLALYNRATGQWLYALPDSQGPVHLPSWAGGELVFGTPHGGHGGLVPPVLLAPKVERPPFSSAMRFVVSGSETCLYVRAAPGLDGEPLACLPDGSRLVLEEENDPAVDNSATVTIRDSMWWVHVRTSAGQVGWAAAPYLEWD